jgi:hypothetical protein
MMTLTVSFICNDSLFLRSCVHVWSCLLVAGRAFGRGGFRMGSGWLPLSRAGTYTLWLERQDTVCLCWVPYLIRGGVESRVGWDGICGGF